MKIVNVQIQLKSLSNNEAMPDEIGRERFVNYLQNELRKNWGKNASVTELTSIRLDGDKEKLKGVFEKHAELSYSMHPKKKVLTFNQFTQCINALSLSFNEKGEQIEKPKDKGICYVECPKCNEKWVRTNMNFCPNCGSKIQWK